MGALAVEDAIRKLLVDDASVSAEVGSRVYYQFPARNAARPFIVLHQVSGDHDHDLSGASGHATTRIQADLCDDRDQLARLKGLAESVRQALQGYSDTVTIAADSVEIAVVTLENQRGDTDNPGAGTDTLYRRVIQDYEVAYAESVPTFE